VLAAHNGHLISKLLLSVSWVNQKLTILMVGLDNAGMGYFSPFTCSVHNVCLVRELDACHEESRAVYNVHLLIDIYPILR
jgi:hypothetical protein